LTAEDRIPNQKALFFIFVIILIFVTAPRGSAAPTVSGITPATGVNTTTVSITDLAGTGFSSGAGVMLTPVSVNPVHKGTISNGGSALLAKPFGVYVSGDYAYVASWESNALEIVDVSNPAAPVHKGSITNGTGGALLNYPNMAYISGNYAYVASQGINALEIVDVSNPAAPVHKGSITDGTGGALLNSPVSVYVSGNYAYVASQGSSALEIVDVSNPAAPVHKGSIINGAGGANLDTPYSVFVSGTYAYVASFAGSALEIVDVTDPAAPVHKGSITDGTGGANLNGPNGVYVSGNYAYVASANGNALEIVDVSNPASPTHKGKITNGGSTHLSSPYQVYISGNYAYVASNGNDALEIVDVSNPAAPVHKGSIVDGAGGANLWSPRAVSVSGTYAYVASAGSNALEIVDTGTVTATGVNVASSTQITGTFDLTGKIAGPYNVVVTNPDGQFGTLASMFTVTVPAPTVSSATATTDGSKIIVSFSKAMADPTGKQAQFTYSVNGGAAQSFSAAALNTTTSKIDLTPSGTALAAGQTITISYTAGTVTSADGGVLATFANQAVTNAIPGGSAPVAAFSGAPRIGTAPLSVTFTDSSSNAPTSWNWSFGDGTYSTTQNPSHTYSSAGTYTVALNATNAVGSNTSTSAWYIRVSPPSPLAAFSGAPTSGSSPLSVTFTDSSTGSPTGWAWFFGDEMYDGPWTQQTASAAWTARRAQTSVAMPDGSIVLMGGYDGSTYYKDVWRSTDNGATWTSMNASGNPGWGARYGHTSVAMPDGSIVLMGGYDFEFGNYQNDVWRSTDNGATWTQVNASAGWTPRAWHSSVVMPDGSIVLMGGLDNVGSKKSDVWRSTDNGVTWTRLTSGASWNGRYSHTSVLLPDGSIVLMGGLDTSGNNDNEVWRSTDNGATWTEVNASAGWAIRRGHTSVAMPDGSIVLMGGIGSSRTNDTWRSSDNGATWINITASLGWSKRYTHSSVVLPDGSIVLIGGEDSSSCRKDVWRFSPAGSSAQNPSHTYSTAGTYSVALQAYNTSGYNSTRKTGYISIMGSAIGSAPVADFDSDLQMGDPPLSVSFTDSSSGSPTGWAWFFGDEMYNGPWTQVNASAGWTARRYHSTVAMPDGSLVLMGGEDSVHSELKDVWRSIDNGATWTLVNASAWYPRYSHSSVVMPDGSIVLMGGLTNIGKKNDVWRSTDNGATWMQMNASAGWSQRYGHTSVTMPDGSIILMGGNDGSYKNDVWRSTDYGVTWIRVNASAGWSGRDYFSSVVMPDNSIVLMGGDDGGQKNDVWRSTDNGVSWTQVNASAGCVARDGPNSVLMPDGSIILMGGWWGGGLKNDTWRSTDYGATWSQINASAGWSGRFYHSSTLLPDGSIVLMGGFDSSINYKNDVWRFNPIGSSVQNPLHTYSAAGIYNVTLQAYNAGGYNTTHKSGYITVTGAAFSANVTSGSAPLAVLFTDSSTNTPTSWNWSFGDGTYSTTQNPSHTYSSGGIFTVALTATNAGGSNTLTRAGYITVIGPKPIPDFSADVTSGPAPLPVSFTDLSLNNPNGWTWFFGDENFTQPWTQVNASAGWLGRSYHSSVALPDGSIVLMGGTDLFNKHDVWQSTDNGAMWTQVNASAGWSARNGHSSVALPDGSIVLMGGYAGTCKNDVWRSTDNGTTWTQVNASAGWSARTYHSSVALPDGSIVLMGGYDGSVYYNDTWRSTDNGMTWMEVNAGAGWKARDRFTSVALPDGSIVLMGGDWYEDNDYHYLNDVWRSTDNGATWTEMTASAGWSTRYLPTSVAMPDGSIVLTGGAYRHDVWRSTDNGATWSEVNASAGWSAREGSTSVAMPDGSIVLMGGYIGDYKNDVWRFQPAGSSAQNPSHTYSAPGTYQVALQAYNAGGYNSTRKSGYITVIGDAPVADFTAVPFAGPAPMTVQFTDTSTNSPTSWSWDFGDGNTSVLQNPTNLYSAIGNYTVTLTAINTGGSNITTRTNYIRVYAAPTGTVPALEWQKSLGGSDEDDAGWIAETPDGGYIVTGSSDSNDGDVSGNHGNFDYWVVKLDAAGTITWERSLGGSENEWISDVKPTSDGGYILTGSSTSDDGDVSGHHGTTATYDYWVVKLDAAGTITWERSLGGSGDDWGYRVHQTPDGGYIVIGDSNSNDGDVTGNHGGNDIWVVKLDAAGTITWERSLGGSGEDSGYSVQHTPDGGYIVTGSSDSNDGDVSGNHGNFDYWIVKLDAAGTITWERSLGGSENEFMSDVKPTSDGGYILTGSSTSDDGDVSGHHGTTATNDYWVVKLDAAGTITWERSLGGSDEDDGYRVQQTSDGGYIVGGSSNSNDGDVTGNHGDYDNWIVKLDSGGNLVWQKSYGGSSSESLSDIQTTSDGGCIFIGLTTTQDGDVQGSHGDNDYWTVKLDSGGSIIWQRPFGGSNEDDGWSFEQTSDGGFIVTGSSNSNDGDVTGNHGNFDYWIVKLEGGGIAPVAGFTANVTSGTVPLAVLFTDSSTNTPTSWNWSFGDGTYSTIQNPSHTYSSVGTYTVALNATNAAGSNTLTRAGYITVSPPAPVAAFSGSPTSGNAPLSVTFTDTSTNTPTGWAWFFGDENFTQPWTQLNASAGWAARAGHSSVLLPDGSIVILGGKNDTTFRNDTWRSTDNGATWTQLNASAGWTARSAHSSVVMPDGTIVLMGGFDGTRDTNDVWKSTDKGASWSLVNASAGWSARESLRSVALPDNSIVLMGGYDGGLTNDTWISTDSGATWVLKNPSSGWTQRYGHYSVALPDNSIVLMGGVDSGGNKDDVWTSTDEGTSWTLINASSGWSARYYHRATTLADGSILLTGGVDSGGDISDVWRSADMGATWTRVNASAGWSARECHSSVAMPDGSVILVGGDSGGVYLNDVWRFQPAGSFVQNPSHTYSSAGTYSVALQVSNAGGYNSTRKSGYITVSAPAVPVASFATNLTSGTGPLTVQFTDTSTGYPTTWNWGFGDGGTSTVQNPLHTYSQFGSYTVSLNITNSSGSANISRRGLITVNGLPGWKFHGDGQNTGVYDDGGTRPNGIKRWEYATGSQLDYSTPAISNGTLYFLNDAGTLYALNASTGSLVWSYATGRSPSHSSPAVANGTVYFGTGFGIDGYFIALDANTGALQWSLHAYDYSPSPVVSNGLVIIASRASNTYYAYNLTTHGEVWSVFQNGQVPLSSPSVGNSMVFAASGNKITSNDIANGTVLWSYASSGVTCNSPAFSNNTVYFACQGADTSVHALFADNGTEAWSADLSAQIRTVPAVAGEVVYAAADRKLVALGAGNGTILWTNSTAISAEVESSPVVANGVVYVGCNDNKIYAFNATTGIETWDFTTGAALYSSPAVANGVVYVGSHDGKMYAIGTTNLPVPVAGFSANITSGTVPLAVLFTDSSTNTPTSWNWSFGDGTYSTTQNPSHTYSSAGTYTVALTATNAGGSNVSTRAGYISVSAPIPVIAFSGSPTSGTAPLTVTFTDSSTNTPTGWAWFFGDETYRQPWTQVNASAGWTARYAHTSVVLPDGSIVLMGGSDGTSIALNDTWRSTDSGATWTLMNASAGWPARQAHSSVALPDGSIVLFGGLGMTGNDYPKGVWRSTDNGATWTQVNASAGCSARYSPTSVVMPDGSIVLMGGSIEGNIYVNDTWRSTDNGATWTQVNASAGWPARIDQSSVVLPDGSIVLMGGDDDNNDVKNDVWQSTDNGATWTQVTASAGWSARHLHTSVMMPDGSIVLMGGFDTAFQNDVWRSTDNGVTWSEVNASAGWPARIDHSSVVLPDGSIVLMGGDDGGIYRNDTWRFMPAGSSAQNPSHIYTMPGNYSVALQAYNTGGYNSTTKSGYITVAPSVTTGPVHNQNTGLNYTTIQAAVDAANAGDTILVDSGTYHEQTDISKSLVLRGRDTGSGFPVVDAGGISGPVSLSTDGITIDSIGFRGSDAAHAGINLTFSHNSNLLNVTSRDNAGTGIYAYSSNNLVISDCTIVNNADDGILLANSTGATIIGNTASGNYHGINLYFSNSSTLVSNNASNNQHGFKLESSFFNTLDRNTAINNTPYAGINLYNASSNNIYNSTVNSNGGEGLDIGARSANNTIRNATILFNVDYGILFSESDTNTVTNSTISSCYKGIVFINSSGNSVTTTYIRNNTVSGVLFDSPTGFSNNNVFYDNYFNNTDNLELYGSTSGNTWNRTKVLATSIIGTPYLGGNFWAQPDGLGFSQLHAASHGDGISDTVYPLLTGETDLLPLTLNTTAVAAPVAAFSGAPLSGTAPLSVTFTDSSTNTPTGWAWFFGDENYTQPWTQQTAGAGWTARYGQSSVVMPDGSIVLMGGYDGGHKNDVWRSTDNGATWTQRTANAGWSARDRHSSVVMPDGSIVLLGGKDDVGLKNDVWRSTDNGITWTQVNASAGWSPRYVHSSVAMPDGSIVLMGGQDSGPSMMNDVWRSTDNGVTWTQQTANAGWSARWDHSSVAMPDGSIVLVGGYDGSNLKNDVWRSTDNGATWTQQTANAGWPARGAHSSVAMPDGSIVLTGGSDNGTCMNDVWRSTDDGATWTQLAANAGWSIRNYHSSVAMPDGSIVLMGGSADVHGTVKKNDAWRFMPAGSSLQNPSHSYTAGGTYSVALQAYNAGGWNSTRKSGYISVNGTAPVVRFSANVTSGSIPLAVKFSDNSIGSLTLWNWSFGDGDFSTVQNPVHTYTANGTFTVRLNVTGAGGTNSTSATNLIHTGHRPVVSFTWTPAEPETGQNVAFDSAGSIDPDGTITGYQWNFGDGTGSTAAAISHTFTEPRVYNVTLTATDNDGFANSTIGQVTVFATRITTTMEMNGTSSETVGGVQSLVINTTTVEDGGGNVTAVSDTTVVLNNASSFWQTVEIRAGNVTETAPGNVTVEDVQEVVLQSAPITAALNETVGDVTVLLDVALQQLVEGAQVDVKVTQGTNSSTMQGFQLAANKSGMNVLDVAYTLELANTQLLNTNLSSSAERAANPVVLTMSVSHAWVSRFNNGTNDDGRGAIVILRYPETGDPEPLATQFLRYDAATNLDWFEAQSPHGLSIFGLISLAAQEAHEEAVQSQAAAGVQQNSDSSDGISMGGNAAGGSRSGAPPANVVKEKGLLPPNEKDLTTTSIGISTPDNLAMLSIPAGVKVTDARGNPVREITVDAESPDTVRNTAAEGMGDGYSFENEACTCGPDGTRFDPAVTLTFTLTEEEWSRITQEGREPAICFYDSAAGRWVDVPTEVNQDGLTITGTITHFTIYGVFSRPSGKAQKTAATPVPAGTTPAQVPKTAVTTVTGMVAWIGQLLENNLLVAIPVILIVVAFIVYAWRQKRSY